MKKGNPWALLPIGVFLAVYLGLGLTFEYIMKIPMGFYNVPIIIAFLIAILVACLQNKKVSFEDKLEIMGQGVGDKNIITMLLIFLVAGAFVGVVGRSGGIFPAEPGACKVCNAGSVCHCVLRLHRHGYFRWYHYSDYSHCCGGCSCLRF